MSDEISEEDLSGIAADVAAEEASPPAAAPKTGPKLTAEQWGEIRAAYELGQKRTPALAEEFGVSTSAISQHFKAHKVVWGRAAKEAAEKAAKKAEAEQITFASKKIMRMEQAKEESWRATELIQKTTWNILAECHKSGTPPAARAADFKALRNAEAIFRENKNVRWHILGVDEAVDKNELTELPILDYTEEHLRKIRAGGEEVIEDEEIKLTTLEEEAEAA